MRGVGEKGYVYVARASRSGLVKIGYSSQPVHRVYQIAADTRQLVDVVAIMHGTRRDEAALLRQMDAYRVLFFGCREWLRPCAEVDAFVASLAPHHIRPLTLGKGVAASLRTNFWGLWDRYSRAIEAHCAQAPALTGGA